jgi:glycosyltransferase involved in cell wall biosynthesis
VDNDNRQIAPKVSVIIPAYNTAKFIGEALDSVFGQTFTDYEVIVVNDGSPDTRELEIAVRPYKNRIVYVLHETNQGLAAARNTGIRQALGQWLAPLDSDDVWLPAYLHEQMEFVRQNPALDISIAGCEIFGDYPPSAHRVWGPASRYRGPVTFEAAVRGEFPQMVTSTVIRKDLAIKAGLFDPVLRGTKNGTEDFEFFARMVFHGAKVDYLHKTSARHRVRFGSLTFHLDDYARGEIIALKRLAGTEAAVALSEGKSLLTKHDFSRAAASLHEANQYYKDSRITLALFGLRVAPRLAAWVINRRKVIRGG